MDTSDFMTQDKGPIIVAAAALMMVLSTLFIGLRFFARYLTGAPLGAQDVIVPFAWLTEVGLCVNGIVMVKFAYTGRHMAYIVTIDPSKITDHFKGIMIMELLHPAAVAFPKLLVVLLYLHILTNKYERMAAKTLMMLIFATWVSYTVAAMFQCTPFAFNWDKTVADGRCFNVQIFANSSSVPNIVTDLAVLVLPLRTVCGLKISIGRRIGLLIIFLTGSVGIIASIFRTMVFARTLTEAGPLVDSTYNHVALVTWTIIEPGIYLLSACALSFKPLFRMSAKAMHLQAFITHTKSTLQPTKSHMTKSPSSIATRTDPIPVGNFRRLSGVSNGGDKKLEVVVTKTVEIDCDCGIVRGTEEQKEVQERHA